MNLQEIDVTIEPNGEVRVEVRGFTGGECLQATEGLEKALGGEIVTREMTAEASQSDTGLSDGDWQTTGN